MGKSDSINNGRKKLKKGSKVIGRPNKSHISDEKVIGRPNEPYVFDEEKVIGRPNEPYVFDEEKVIGRPNKPYIFDEEDKVSEDEFIKIAVEPEEPKPSTPLKVSKEKGKKKKDEEEFVKIAVELEEPEEPEPLPLPKAPKKPVIDEDVLEDFKDELKMLLPCYAIAILCIVLMFMAVFIGLARGSAIWGKTVLKPAIGFDVFFDKRGPGRISFIISVVLSVILGLAALFFVITDVLGDEPGCIGIILLALLLGGLSYIVVRFLIAIIGYIIYVFVTPYVAIFFAVAAFAAMGFYILYEDISLDLFVMPLVITKVQIAFIIISVLVSMIVCLVYGFRMV